MASEPTYEELKQRIKALEKGITENKQPDKFLVEKEFENSIIDNAPIFFVAMDAQGKTLMMNQSMLKILGYETNEVVGYDYLSNFVPKDDRALLSSVFRKLTTEHEKTINENHILSKDGKEILVEWHGRPVFDSKHKLKYYYGLGTNITERKQAEKALRNSEQKFRDLIENSSDWVWEVNRKGVYTYSSPRVKELLGYEPEEVIGKTPFEFMPAEEAKRVSDIFNNFISSREPFVSLENTNLHKYGNRIIVETSGVPFFNAEGEFLGYRGIDRDITERKQVEDALRESEIKHKTLVNNIPGMVYRGFPDWSAEIVSGCERITGYTTAELNKKEKGWFSIIYPDDIERFSKASVVLATKSKDLVQTYRIIHKTGNIRWVEDRKTAFISKEGDFLGIDGIVFDITERKHAEKALRESEEKYRNILKNIDDGYFEVDIAGNFTFLNDSMCKIIGYPKNELMGMNYRKYMDEENANKAFLIFNKVYRTGISTKTLDWKITRKDGSENFVETVVSLIKDSNGNEIGFRSVARDVNERKQLESQLQQAMRMDSIGKLAGGIAHDFNNLLMGIQGRTSLMLFDKDFSHPDFEQLKGIEDHVISAVDLTKQLLGFARGGKYEVKATDINELIKKSSQMFGRTKKEIKIHRKHQKNIWAVETDQGQIEQILMNLYVNAWQAMPNGGDLYIQTENVKLDENYVRAFEIASGRYVKISVIDTGIGMDESTQQRIFEPFYTTKGMGRGTGLGLASTYGIIKNHGGFIDVYSEIGKGTTINIYLPSSDKMVVEAKQLTRKIEKGDGTILIVDDEEIITEVGGQLLKRLGYLVMTAKSGQEALELYEGNMTDIDMVILDMIMPGMSGGETHDRLKEINPNIKILLSSGYSINGQAQEILDRGCNGFIQKPFNITELSKKVRNVLDEATFSKKL